MHQIGAGYRDCDHNESGFRFHLGLSFRYRPTSVGLARQSGPMTRNVKASGKNVPVARRCGSSGVFVSNYSQIAFGDHTIRHFWGSLDGL
jgi:hypothetical protein